MRSSCPLKNKTSSFPAIGHKLLFQNPFRPLIASLNAGPVLGGPRLVRLDQFAQYHDMGQAGADVVVEISGNTDPFDFHRMSLLLSFKSPLRLNLLEASRT